MSMIGADVEQLAALGRTLTKQYSKRAKAAQLKDAA
jgi:hypothetical protein